MQIVVAGKEVRVYVFPEDKPAGGAAAGAARSGELSAGTAAKDAAPTGASVLRYTFQARSAHAHSLPRSAAASVCIHHTLRGYRWAR